MWELDCEESWVPKNWCFWTVVLEKTLESPLDCKEIQPIHPKGDQPWVFIGRTDAEPEIPILWPPDVKSWLIGKDPDAVKDLRWEEKGMTEDEMIVWHSWLNGYEPEQTPGVSGGHGGLACCSPWGHKESDMTEQLNWLTEWMNGLVVFTTFFNLIQNFILRSSWWATLSSHFFFFFADCRELLHLGCKECNQSHFGIGHLMLSLCRLFSYVVGRVCLLWPACSLGKTI